MENIVIIALPYPLVKKKDCFYISYFICNATKSSKNCTHKPVGPPSLRVCAYMAINS